MRILFSEYPAEYGKYNFPYQVYGVVEPGDSIDSLYEMGLLPTRINKDLFYLCRSVRVGLDSFELNSENRRVSRKTSFITAKLFDLKKFEYHYEIGKIAKDFSKARYTDHILSPQSVKKLFLDSSMTHVIEFKDKNTNKVIGYCLCLLTDKSFHYSYPFYDLEYLNKNLGMGMILSSIKLAVDLKMSYFYLGTCYTEGSIYKLQFNNMEYYTGFGWSESIQQLKQLIRKPQEDHLFKLIEDKESFIKLFQDVE